jgi:hypothetical protein
MQTFKHRGVALASAARTAAPADTVLDLARYEGLIVVLKVSAGDVGFGLTLTIKGKDALGNAVNLLSASQVTAPGTTCYVVHPHATVPAGEGITKASATPLPQEVVLNIAVAGAQSVTYSLCYELLP